MRFLLLLPLALVLSNCGPVATYNEILSRSKAEVSARENWSDVAYIRIDKEPGYSQPVWRVSAGAFDYSGYPEYRGINLLPGTERVLRFTREGCLVSYGYGGSRCDARYMEPAVMPMPMPADTK